MFLFPLPSPSLSNQWMYLPATIKNMCSLVAVWSQSRY